MCVHAPLHMCVYIYVSEDGERNCCVKCMSAKIVCGHIFKAIKATETYVHCKHAPRDNIREGEREKIGKQCLHLVPV